jgi:hypothetical protein
LINAPAIGWALLSSTNESQVENTVGVTQQLMKPKVMFPTKEQVLAYIVGHREPVRLNDPLIGNVSDAQVAIAGNTTWVAWLGKVNGSNNVFLSVSSDGGNTFLQPNNVTILSNATGGNASKLSLGVSTDAKNVYAVWRSTNLETGQNVIIYRSSMDSGEEFKTYPISSPNVDSDYPTLTVEGDNLLVTWIVKVRDWITDQDPCSSNYPTQNNTGPVKPGEYTVMCAHNRSW